MSGVIWQGGKPSSVNSGMASSGSYTLMCRPGEHGRYQHCPSCDRAESCEGIKDASVAPLCALPPYMASRYSTVRTAAKARFIELKEEKIEKEMNATVSKAFPDLVGKIPVLVLKSNGDVWECSACSVNPLVSKLLVEVSKASLNKLVEYIASRFPEVRQAAKARFVELYP